MSTPQRILIVRLGAMGDIIHAMPAVSMLRSMFPGCKVGWVIERRWSELLRSRPDATPLSEEQPLVDFVHLVDTRKWRKSPLERQNRQSALGAWREIRGQRYDRAIDFQGAIKSGVVAMLSQAKMRIGFADPWEKPAAIFYTKLVTTERVHVVERNLALVESQREGTWKTGSLNQLLPQGHEVKEELEKLGLQTRFAILNPGAGWGAKQWPVDRYADVARALGGDGVRSLVNFGPGEEAMAKAVEENSAGYAIAAQFTISQLIAMTRRAALFIGGDTGPLHLAAALNVPVVALFGPTDPARTGPYGTRSIVLRDPLSVTSHKRNRETEAGLKNITSGQVIAAARELLAKGEGA